MKGESRFSIWLFAAFAAMSVVFVGSSIYSNWRSVSIEGESELLLTNALPSVDHLTSAVDALHDLEAATDDLPEVPAQHQPEARQHIDALWRAVDAELLIYLAVPAFPGERELYADVPESLRALDAAMQRLFVNVAAGETLAARLVADHEVRAAASHAAHLLRHLVRFNAIEAAASSRRIQETRSQVTRLAVILNALALLFSGGTAFWVLRLFRAHSRLARSHEALMERRADELEVFSRRVAHDLLSPISSLSFCLGAFKRVAESDPKLENALGRARLCVQNARSLVENIFDFSRSGGRPNPGERTDVAEVIAQVVEEARATEASEELRIDVRSAPGCTVRCSRGVLASILGNLVRNALKYTRDSAVRRIDVRALELGNDVRLEVEDTGPGVPPGLEQSIFEPYVRGEGVTQPGLGLGLATVKRFSEAHGGTVGVRSVSGQGSVFFVTLPRADAAVAAVPPVSPRIVRGAR